MLHTPEQDILPQAHLLARPPTISLVILSPVTPSSLQCLSSADVALQKTVWAHQDLVPTEMQPNGD